MNPARGIVVCAGMLLSDPDQKHVDRDAFDFANKHRDDKFGVDLRRSDIVAAAERASDELPPEGKTDEREKAVIWQFSSQVFRQLGLDVTIA